MEDIKETLKEIKIVQEEIRTYKTSIELLHNSLKYEIEHRQMTQAKIKDLEQKIDVLEKEINISEVKIKEIDQKIQEVSEFKRDIKNFFWKVLFTIIAGAGTVIAAYYSQNLK